MAFEPTKEEPKPKISKDELRHLFEKAVEKGALDTIFHFDAHGADKDAVENAMIDMIARCAKEPGVLYCTGEIDRAIQTDDMYSCAAEVKILASNYNTLTNIALKYGPIAVEILRPHKVELTLEEAQSCLLDISQAVQDFSQFAFEKILKGEDARRYEEQVRNRAELGQQLRDGKKEEKKD